MDKIKTAPKSFEEAVNELEQIVDTLEMGDIELEKSLELYERGMYLSSYLKKTIEAGKDKIISISKQNGVILEKDYITEE